MKENNYEDALFGLDEEQDAETTPEPQTPPAPPKAEASTPPPSTPQKTKAADKKTSRKDIKQEARKKGDEKIAADGFGAWLKHYLDSRAAENEEFAKVYANPDKSLRECILYIAQECFKKQFGGMAVISNEVVEGLAMHYYQESDCKPDSDTADRAAFAVTSQMFPLSKEDMSKVREMAMESIRNDAVEAEKKKIREDIKSGKTKIDLSDEERKAIDAAAREQILEESKKRQGRRKQEPKPDKKPAEEENLLF